MIKVKDISKMHNLPVERVEAYVKSNSQYQTTYSMFGGLQINEADIESIIAGAREYSQQRDAEIAAEEAAAKEAERVAAQQEIEKQKAMSEMLITSGFSFDGYTVAKYSGYISGDDAMQIDRGQDGIFSSATNVGDALMYSLTEIRRNALAELKEQAYALGCNAIIGVDFDYLTLEPETVSSSGGTLYMPYVFGVTANGNAVKIEKND